MMRILRNDGTYEAFPEAVSGRVAGYQLLLYGSRGQIVAQVPANEVVVYGNTRAFEEAAETYVWFQDNEPTPHTRGPVRRQPRKSA